MASPPETSLIRQSPYTAEQMYALVADVAAYKEFLPYCTGSRVRSVTQGPDGQKTMQADLMIAYKVLRETYTSEVMLDDAHKTIRVTQAHGPFRKLLNEWRFTDKPSGGSEVHFYLDFEFQVPLLRQVIQPIMGRAVEKFIGAFEDRAHDLYGNQS